MEQKRRALIWAATHARAWSRGSGEHRGRQSLQTLIGCQKDGCFSPGQSQIEAVVDRVIEMARQCQGFHLKVTVGLDVIHERTSPAEALLQAFDLQLASSLEPPESIRHFGEHQLWRQDQFSVENRLLEGSCLRRALDDSHHR